MGLVDEILNSAESVARSPKRGMCITGASINMQKGMMFSDTTFWNCNFKCDFDLPAVNSPEWDAIFPGCDFIQCIINGTDLVTG